MMSILSSQPKDEDVKYDEVQFTVMSQDSDRRLSDEQKIQSARSMKFAEKKLNKHNRALTGSVMLRSQDLMISQLGGLVGPTQKLKAEKDNFWKLKVDFLLTQKKEWNQERQKLRAELNKMKRDNDNLEHKIKYLQDAINRNGH